MGIHNSFKHSVIGVILWISFSVVGVLAPPTPITNDRFPEQELSPPEQMRDGQTLGEKSFVMKMINILERKIEQELGVRRRLFWTRDYVFEGDIILQKDQALQLVTDKSSRRKRKITLVPTERWELPINYKFDGSHTSQQREKIREGIQHWENQTCLTFTNDETYTNKSIIFINDTGCYSFVGKQHGNSDQIVSIGINCTKKGTVAHEVGHVIGFWHEHARPDRDDYIKILYNNVFMSEYYNFHKRTWAKMDNLGVPYDIGSLMHYSGETFSMTSEKTVQSWNPLLQFAMGQRNDLSFYDVKLANLAYCSDICNSTDLIGTCLFDGYQDPKNCSRCRCPDGLGGDNCERVAQSTGNCGGVITLNSSSYINIATPGYPHTYAADLRCYWLIQSPAGTAIRMVFNEPYMNSTSYCETRKPFVACVDFVEVRFTDNLGNTGGRFCCDDSYQRQQLYNPIVSHNNHSLILFKSWKSGARGINISISIDSCGGCRNNIASQEVPCQRTVRKECYNTWQIKTKLPGCSYWVWCETQYVYKTISRPSVCYEEEKYCCDGYTLENNMCVLNASDTTSTPSPAENHPNTTESTTNSSPEKDEAPPGDNASSWSSWSPWEDCSVSCGGCGTTQRYRTCHGDIECRGENNQTEPCNLETCDTISAAYRMCYRTTSYVYECGPFFAPQNCTQYTTTSYSQTYECCCGYEVDPTTGLCVLS